MGKRMLKMVLLGIKQFKDPYYQGFAAQLSFYFMLSLVPTILLISQALGYFMETSIQDAAGFILRYAKGDLGKTLQSLLTYRSGGALNIVYIIVALWAGSRAQFSLMRITNFTFTEGRSTGPGYWRERLRAIGTMAVNILGAILALVVLVYGGKILKYAFGVGEVWLYLRWPMAMALYFMMVSHTYYRLPSERVRFTEIIPGSIFAAAGMLTVTLVYSVYTDSIANYDILYGTLGSIVALMFWFYFLAWVLCLGVMVNKVWMETHGSRENYSDI